MTKAQARELYIFLKEHGVLEVYRKAIVDPRTSSGHTLIFKYYNILTDLHAWSNTNDIYGECTVAKWSKMHNIWQQRFFGDDTVIDLASTTRQNIVDMLIPDIKHQLLSAISKLKD